jgi:hypothetical protein
MSANGAGALSGATSLLFPATQGVTLPMIGQAFDPVNGIAPAISGFDPPPDKALIALARVNNNSQYFSIYDASTFADATDFDLQTSGGGWGASVGMTFQASSRIQSDATSYTVHLNAAATSSQKTVKSETKLSPAAAKVLKGGVAGFVEKYGTHFVAGYVYGKTCKLSYHLKFTSLSVKEQFQASYSESTSELGFSDSLSASLSNALSLSHTTCSIKIETNCIGFDYTPPQKLSDLGTIASAYGAATAETLSPVAIIVLPWSFLSEVSEAMGTDLTGNTDVADLVNALLYIQNSCSNFRAAQLYVGNTQFQNVSKVQAKVTAEVDAILALLSAANANHETVSATDDGQQVTVQAGSQTQSFPIAEPIVDEMNVALGRFAISWLAYFQLGGMGSADTGPVMTDLQGNPITVILSTTMDGRTGTYFTWTDNSAGWTVTSGTSRSAYNLAGLNAQINGTPVTVYFTILLDWAKGTIRGMVRTNDQGDFYSAEMPVRGEVNSRDCEDATNPYRTAADGTLNYAFGAEAYKFHLSPM